MAFRKTGSALDRNENLAGALFILPSFVGFLVFVLFPVVFSLFLSFNEWSFAGGFNTAKFVGLNNYLKLGKDEWFTSSLKNTLIFAVTTVPINLFLGVFFAVIIDKFVVFKTYAKVAVFVPYISSIVASAVIWLVMFHPSYGPINLFLTSVGITNPPKWFVDMKWALPSVIMFSIWQQFGYYILVYMAGLKGIPVELYEAADIDGANEIHKFTKITLPMISPTTFFLAILGIIGSFKVFDQISVLTEGGPGSATSVIAYYIYREAFQYYHMGLASAGAWVMFIIIFAITAFQWKYQKNWVNY